MTLEQYNQLEALQKEFFAKVIEIIPLPMQAHVEISIHRVPVNAPVFKKLKTNRLGFPNREFLVNSAPFSRVKIFSEEL